MTRTELIERLASRFPSLTDKDARQSALLILDAMTNAMGHGDRIEIRGFGSFKPHYHQPRKSRNPKTGEKVQVPAKFLPSFKTGEELRQRVNRQVKLIPSIAKGTSAALES